MKVKEKAAPYAQRLLDDRELQRDLREAMTALRTGFSRAESKRRKPSRLAKDKKFKKSAQRAAASLKDASARFQGEPPKKHRARKLLILLLVAAGLAFAAKQFLGEDDPNAAQPPVA